jgi:thiol-disulfide isomerase/thioredoxin/uncharacterized membrane protein YphA (DoxX/SURF4 family)
MNAVLLVLRLILALVFLVAGFAKLADRDGSREAAEAFGVPDSLAGPTAILLPIAELIAAALLVPSATARAGAVLAATLLIAFCAGITRSIVRGQAPECHCFGQLHSSPAGPKTLARNLILAAAAALVAIAGAGTSATAWIGELSNTAAVALIAAMLLVAVLAACGAFALSLLRQHGRLLLRVDALEQALEEHGIAVDAPNEANVIEPTAGLPPDASAPDFQLLDIRHRKIGLNALNEGSAPLVLLFTDPGCGPCSTLLPRVAEWQREHSDALRIALISRGDRDANVAHAREHGLTDVLIQRDREVSERYLVNGTPSAVLITADGTIGSPLHEGADAIAMLVNGLIAPPALDIHHHQPAIGADAPGVTLRTLDGEESALSSVLSGPTVVLFWRPSCGFCERMLPDLKEFEEAPPADAPSLLLISTDDPETNRAMGLNAPILLDDSFAAGTAFGASGTPSAVLVDAEGRIASRVAVGAPEVLELMRSGAPVAVAERRAA